MSIHPVFPNLFVVGSFKCGTTSLHKLLGRHPQVFMLPERLKEPGFFADAAPDDRRRREYLALFEGAGAARYAGESSTQYTRLPTYPGCAERIHAHNPKARVVYIMRDPIVRAISHYWWQVEWSGEGRNMMSVLKSSNEIVDVGHYARQLTPYREIFGRQQVYALTLEELMSDTARQKCALFEWLGVDVVDQVELARDNPSAETVGRVIGSGQLAKLKGGPVWTVLKKGWHAFSPVARMRLQNMISRPVRRELDPATRQAVLDYLRPRLQPQVRELERCLQRGFPQWRLLWGTEPGGNG